MRLRRLIAAALIGLCASVCGTALVAVPAFAMGAAGATTTTPSLSLQGAAQQAATQTATTATTTTTSSSGGFSTKDGIIIAVIGVVVLLGISGYVLYDARRHAHGVTHSSEYDLEHGTSRSGSKAARKSRKLSAAEKKRRKRGQAPKKRRN